jgi:hypothetical protein
MSVNRYTNFTPQQYVETYVPLPLDFINQQGAMLQKDLDKHKSALSEDTDPLSKLGDLSFAMKIYDRQGNVIDSVDDTLEKEKNNRVKELSLEREQLSKDLAENKITVDEFKAKSKHHISRANTAYNELNVHKENVKKITDAQKEYAKQDHFGRDSYYGDKLIEYGTNYMNKVKQGIYDPYIEQSIADKFDRNEALAKQTTNWTKTGSSKDNIVSDEYINTHGWVGVGDTEVERYAESTWQNASDPIRQDSELRVMHDLHRYGLTGEETKDNKGNDLTYTNPFTGKKEKVNAKELMLNEQRDNYKQELILRVAGGVEKDLLKTNTPGLRRLDIAKEDAERAAKLKLDLGKVATPADAVQTIESLNNKIKADLGDGYSIDENNKLHYAPTTKDDVYYPDGTKKQFINVFGKEFDVEEGVTLNGQNFRVDYNDETGNYMVQLPVGGESNDYKWVTYKPYTKKESTVEDVKAATEKLTKAVKRLGYTPKPVINAKGETISGGVEDAKEVYTNYLNTLTQQTEYSVKFGSELVDWMNKHYGVKGKTDAEGNLSISDPGDLASMTIKTASGSLIDDTKKDDILAGAEIRGFSKSAYKKSIKPGDLEIVTTTGERYILETGSKALADATAKSDRLMKSYNDYFTTGQAYSGTQYTTQQLTTALAKNARVDKLNLNVVGSEENENGEVYVSTMMTINKKPILTVYKLNPDLTLQRTLKPIEAAQELDSEGLIKNIGILDPKEASRTSKTNYDQNIENTDIIDEYDAK